MSVSFEKIEELRKRANISYEEAKKILEKHNGDIVEALIELEKRKKIREQKAQERCFSERIKRLFAKGNRTRFYVTRKGEIILNVPINYLIFVTVFAFYITIISLAVIFVSGCKMTIKKAEGDVVDVDDVIFDVSRKVRKATKDFTQDKPAKNQNNAKNKKDDNDYNEYTVE